MFKYRHREDGSLVYGGIGLDLGSEIGARENIFVSGVSKCSQ